MDEILPVLQQVPSREPAVIMASIGKLIILHNNSIARILNVFVAPNEFFGTLRSRKLKSSFDAVAPAFSFIMNWRRTKNIAICNIHDVPTSFG